MPPRLARLSISLRANVSLRDLPDRIRATLQIMRRLAPFLADLWQHRELLWQFTQRRVELRHKGSHLGLALSFANPLLMLGLYVLVFGYIFGGNFGVLPDESRIDYGLGIFLGLSLFHFCAEVLNTAPTLILTNPNFVKKVVFPLEILPAAAVGAAAFHLAISLSLVLAGALLFGHGLDSGVLWLFVVLPPLVLTALGVSWLFSALGVFFRDITQLTQFLSAALMFASATFYSAQKIATDAPFAWQFLRFNPLLLAIESARDGVLWGRTPNPTHLTYLWLFSLLACALGHLAFKKMKPAFADVL
jgi:lipopolysaccharide transport system permease protein